MTVIEGRNAVPEVGLMATNDEQEAMRWLAGALGWERTLDQHRREATEMPEPGVAPEPVIEIPEPVGGLDPVVERDRRTPRPPPPVPARSAPAASPYRTPDVQTAGPEPTGARIPAGVRRSA
jgi:hypothetical protein